MYETLDARNERIESEAAVKGQQCLSGIEKGKGICYQWKEEGQCSKGDQCSFQHESDDRAHNTATIPPHCLSHPCHDVVVCRRKEVSKAKVTMVPFSDNRGDTI